jgi:hypothetical protein
VSILQSLWNFLFAWLDAINAWISTHQPLLISVVVPLLTLFVSQRASRSSERAAAKSKLIERRLQSEMRIAEFRQVWIDKLREAFVDIIENCSKPIRTGNEDYPIVMARVARVELMMNPRDPDYGKLKILVDQLRAGDHSGVPKELVTVSQAILKREWDRLKGDLAKVEQAELP